jgi:hypothetical protein
MLTTFAQLNGHLRGQMTTFKMARNGHKLATFGMCYGTTTSGALQV